MHAEVPFLGFDRLLEINVRLYYAICLTLREYNPWCLDW